MFFRWGENKRNEIRNTSAIRDGAAQDGQLPLWRANRALVGDWVHVFGAGTVFNLRSSYTYFLEWSYSTQGLGFDATAVLALESRPAAAEQADRRDLPAHRASDEFVSLSRGSAPNRNKIYTLQPNVSLNRGAHNIRSGLDVRWTNVFAENYNNSGGLVQFNRNFTRSTLNSTSVLEGNAFASFLLGAPSGGQVDVNPTSHYQWFFAAPWIQDDWRVNNKLTREPRLPLGLQRRGDGSGQQTELRVRPDARQPGLRARRAAGAGGHQVRWRGRRTDTAVEVRQEQLPVPWRHGLLDQQQDRVPRRMGKVLPEPDRVSRSTTGFAISRRNRRVE